MTIPETKLNKMTEKKYFLLLIVIILLTFFLRLSNIYLHPKSFSEVKEEHGVFADNIYNGYGFKLDKKLPPTAFRTPLYPYWLAFLYSLFGYNSKVALAGQCLLDAVTAFFLFLLGKLLFNSSGIGLFASFLWSIYLPEFYYTEKLYAEIMATTLLIIHIYFIVKAWKEPIKKGTTLNYALAGIFLGLASLTRPEYQFFFIFLMISFFMSVGKEYKKQIIKGYWIMAFSFFLILSPWIIRNYMLFKEIIPGTTELGHVIYNRAIDNEQGYKYGIDPEISRIYKESSGKYGSLLVHPDYSEAELNGLLTKEMLRVISNHPFKFAHESIQRLLHSWFNYHGWKDRPFTANDLFFIFVNMIFFLSIIYSHVWCRQDWLPYAYPLLLIIIYKSIIHALLAGGPRSFLPIWPYFMIYFSYAFFKFIPSSLQAFRR